MFEGYPGATVGGFVLALLPAALRWWWGRALARAADDPLIAERLAAHQSRCGAVAGACAALLFLGLPSTTPVTTPLLLVAYAAGGFPLRKALYGETWSLAGYLTFLGRLIVAVFGFWILLALLPWAGLRAPGRDRIGARAAALLAAGVTSYIRPCARMLRTSYRGRPLLERCNGRRGQGRHSSRRVFECVRHARRRPGERARAAVTARRIGPLHRYAAVPAQHRRNRRHLRARTGASAGTTTARACAGCSSLNYVLIALAAAAAPLSLWWFPAHAAYVGTIIFPAAMFIALMMRGRHRQRNETASDLRAVELTGNPESLVSGLTALHTIGRVPRRWDSRANRAATHPSLARRLRDIRAASGLAAPAPTTTRTFAAASGGTLVSFDPGRLTWTEQGGTTHLLNYDALSELRLHASPTGGISLVAVERQGRRWQMTPRTVDQQELQATLDSVDGRLTHETPARVFSAVVTRLVAGWRCSWRCSLRSSRSHSSRCWPCCPRRPHS